MKALHSRVGDYGPQIKLPTIQNWIPMNSDDDYMTIQILKSKSYHRFWFIFDLFLIKFDQNQYIFYLFWLKYRKISLWTQLKRLKSQNQNKNWYNLSFSNWIWSNLIYFWSLSIDFELFNWIWIQYNQCHHYDSDWDNKFGSKNVNLKSIQLRLKLKFQPKLIQSPKLSCT